MESAEHKILVSIIILTHHRLELVQKCLDSLWSQDLGEFELEIISLINGLDNDTLRYFETVKEIHSNFSFEILSAALPVGEARNKIISKASGKYICFIDDDIILPPNYFQKASNIIKLNPDVDVFGGPDATTQQADNFQIVLGEVMKSFWAMGPTALRHRQASGISIEGNEINLILCNLWMKTELFKDGFSFPSDYIRNEENVLLAKIKNNRNKLLYVPDFFVFHERKNSYKKLIRSNFYSGIYRTIGFFDEKSSFNFYFLIPQIVMLFGICSILINFKITIAIVLAYLINIVYLSLKISRQLSIKNSFIYATSFFIIYNFVYTFGLFVGYKKILNWSKNE